ncbi:hypothetical protein P3S67_000373 [Capsicum chacoense]
MDCVKLVLFFMLFPFLFQLSLSSSSPPLFPKDQPLGLLQFKNMFTINHNTADCYYVPTTLSWNKSIDCCSWNGVCCDKMTGQVIELDLFCGRFQGKFHSNSSLFQLSNLKQLVLADNDFFRSLISPKFESKRLATMERLQRFWVNVPPD